MSGAIRFQPQLLTAPRRGVRTACAVLAWLLVAGDAAAHPLILARAEVQFAADGRFELMFHGDVAALVMQASTGHLDDLLAAELRNMPAADVAARLEDARRLLGQQLRLEFDDQPARDVQIELPAAMALQGGDPPGTLPEATRFSVRGQAPAGARRFTVQFPADLGNVTLTVRSGDRPVLHQPLAPAEWSFPFALGSDAPPAADRWLDTARRYLLLGFEHIIPRGLDHILFVLGLFLLSPRFGPLAWQVTAFTVAHSLTLALSMYGVVSLPARVVEPLIAASIALVAIENVATARLHAWRPVVVFLFGLLHGLGFAGVLGGLGLPQSDFATALVAFNLGVEAGQLAVIGLAYAAVGSLQARPWYRARVVVPASLLIAMVGLYWTIERIVG